MALMHVQDRMSGNNCERGSLTLKTQLERESFLRLSAPLLGEEEPRESEKASVPAAALRAVYGHYVALGWLNGIAISTAFAYCYYEERASANTCTARPGVPNGRFSGLRRDARAGAARLLPARVVLQVRHRRGVCRLCHRLSGAGLLRGRLSKSHVA